MGVPQHDRPSTIERVAPLSGVGFAVLAGLGAALLMGDNAFLDPARDIAGTYADDTGRILGGSQLLVLGAALLVWFGGSLRSAIAAAEGGHSRLGGIAFGGTAAAGALLLAGAATHAAGALRADDVGVIDPVAAATLSDLAWVLIAGAAPVAMGVAAGATGLAALRTRAVLPSWLTWVTLVMAVGLVILPINFAVSLVFSLWAIVTGVHLYARQSRAEAASAAPGTPAA